MTVFIAILLLWIFSVCLHEFAHAWVAYRGGDYTVADKGYLEFNPFRYTDPINSIVLPIVFLALGGLGLPGGAVYIDTRLLRSRKWETAVSLAGPAANLLFALAIGMLFRLHIVPRDASNVAAISFAFLALLQVSSVLFNLLPVPGFDGFGAIAPWLPYGLRHSLEQMRGIAFFIVFLLMWNVPILNHLFWGLTSLGIHLLGIPPGLATEGYHEFTFWR